MENVNWKVSRFDLHSGNTVVAFAGNSETHALILSSSGHPTIARHFTVDFGGWLWLSEEKMIEHCGYFGRIPVDLRGQVRAVLCNYFKKEFRFI